MIHEHMGLVAMRLGHQGRRGALQGRHFLRQEQAVRATKIAVAAEAAERQPP